MIIEELAYKVTIKADEFLNGKRKIGTEVAKLENEVGRSSKNINRSLGTMTGEVTQFGKAAVSSFRGVTVAAAGFLGIGAGLYGIKQLFSSTANEIVRASQQAKFFGSDVNKVFGVRRGFQQAGLNGDAFIGAAGNARMALANIADPTIFGGLTGAAQNLMVLGARTGLNINQLGDPNKALTEFTRYGKSHSQENLMQVLASAGFDPSDAAKIKSGELKSLVDSETKKSNITAQQVREQEELLVTLGKLDAEFDRIRLGLVQAFTPEVIAGMKAFGDWMRDHQGDITGFFKEAGETVKKFTDAVGGANALLILLALGLRSNPLVMAAIAATSAANSVGNAQHNAASEGKSVGQYLVDMGKSGKTPLLTWDDIVSFFRPTSAEPRNPSGRNLAEKNNNPGNIRGSSGLGGFAGYETEQGGWDAMSNQLMRYFNGLTTGKRLRNVKDIISTWAPPSENDTDSYIKEVSAYMRVGANEELNLADPNVMAKLRTAIARREGFGNWKNGMNVNAGDHQFQNQYYLQQQQWANARASNMNSSVDNSRTNSTHIGQVVVNTNPQTADALTKSIEQQHQRSSTNASFFSGVR